MCLPAHHKKLVLSSNACPVSILFEADDLLRALASEIVLRPVFLCGDGLIGPLQVLVLHQVTHNSNGVLGVALLGAVELVDLPTE